MIALQIKKWNGEYTYGLPEGTAMYRCATDDNQILVFPDNQVVIGLFKNELGLDVTVLRRYDTCLILAIPNNANIDKGNVSDFLNNLSELVSNDPQNSVYLTSRDKYS